MSLSQLFLVVAIVLAGIATLSVPTGRFSTLAGAVLCFLLYVAFGQGAIHIG